jgi:hypothetical protein
MMSGRPPRLLTVWLRLRVGLSVWCSRILRMAPVRRLSRRRTALRIRREGRLARVLIIGLLRIHKLGFLPPSGQGLGLLAPLCAVPPAQGLLPDRVEIPSGRLPCSGIVPVVWWRLIAHGFLSPLRGCGAALSRSKDASKAVAVHAGMKLTCHCYRAVFAWREQSRHRIRGCRDQLRHSPRPVLRFGCDVFL